MTDWTGTVARFMTSAAQMSLSEQTLDRAMAHTLDTLAAMVSGATLEPGRLATAITASRREPGGVTVIGDGSRTSWQSSDDASTCTRPVCRCVNVRRSLSLVIR